MGSLVVGNQITIDEDAGNVAVGGEGDGSLIRLANPHCPFTVSAGRGKLLCVMDSVPSAPNL